MKYDLHMHSNFSACANPSNDYKTLLTKCKENELDVISITDHNAYPFHLINMYQDITPYFSGKIIIGMECDVNESGIGFEVLAYNFDPVKLLDWTYSTYGTLESRQTKLKDKLIELIELNNLYYDKTLKYNPKTDYAHHYIYDAMKCSKTNEQLFKKYNIKNVHDFYRNSTANKDFPLYVHTGIFSPSIKTVLENVHNAGGVVVLAHPYNYNNIDAETLIQLAVENNIDGIEIYHPSADETKQKYMLDIANKHNLIITGGSDYHGTTHRGTMCINNASDIQINIDKLCKEN